MTPRARGAGIIAAAAVVVAVGVFTGGDNDQSTIPVSTSRGDATSVLHVLPPSLPASRDVVRTESSAGDVGLFDSPLLPGSGGTREAVPVPSKRSMVLAPSAMLREPSARKAGASIRQRVDNGHAVRTGHAFALGSLTRYRYNCYLHAGSTTIAEQHWNAAAIQHQFPREVIEVPIWRLRGETLTHIGDVVLSSRFASLGIYHASPAHWREGDSLIVEQVFGLMIGEQMPFASEVDNVSNDPVTIYPAIVRFTP